MMNYEMFVEELKNKISAAINIPIENIEFSKDGDRIWQCRNCGHIVIGKEAPAVCPVCNHPQSYFELKAENY